MEVTPLISVIVPIYNVAPYIQKCLESLINQTMREIEIICIDDGSTDESGRIADEYTKNDERFRVIHTENRGLSAARNRGIDETRADWLMFVDSDDWVDSRYCEIPYQTAIKNDCDLVIFGSSRIEHGIIKIEKQRVYPIGIVDEMTAHEYGGVSPWNKLYKKSLFDSIRYPDNHVYEDMATTHKLVHLAERIGIVEDILYFHNYRNGSISNTHSALNSNDYYRFGVERNISLCSWGYPKEKLIDEMNANAIGVLMTCDPVDDEVYLNAQKVVDSINIAQHKLNYKKKIALYVYRKNRKLFDAMCKIGGQRLRLNQTKYSKNSY